MLLSCALTQGKPYDQRRLLFCMYQAALPLFGGEVRIAMPPDPDTDMADVLSPEPSIQTMQRFYVG